MLPNLNIKPETDVAGGKTGTVTNKDLYDALTNVRVELKGDIKDLRTQFDSLESGRLTRAEGHINDIRLELQRSVNASSAISFKVVVIWGIIGTLGVAIINAVVLRLIGVIK